jgi:hypothetical protein
MKIYILFILLLSTTLFCFAQETKEVIMEKRAREMHRVLGINDPAQWRKFIKENYTQALIDKPMRAKVQTSDDGSDKSSASSSADNLEAKVGMFERLHSDFGDSKITSLKVIGDNVEMIVLGEMGLKGTFKFKFDPIKPHLISGLGIEAGN